MATAPVSLQRFHNGFRSIIDTTQQLVFHTSGNKTHRTCKVKYRDIERSNTVRGAHGFFVTCSTPPPRARLSLGEAKSFVITESSVCYP